MGKSVLNVLKIAVGLVGFMAYGLFMLSLSMTFFVVLFCVLAIPYVVWDVSANTIRHLSLYRKHPRLFLRLLDQDLGLMIQAVGLATE